MIIESRATKIFGSCSGQGRDKYIIYPFSLAIFYDLLCSDSCPLILLSSLPGRYSSKIICRRSMLNDKAGACVSWSGGS